MARIVCQVLHRANRVTVIWSDGAAYFEPYHFDQPHADRFQDAARQLAQQLGQGADLALLAVLGDDLYHQLFQLDQPNAGAAHAVHAWWTDLRRRGAVQSLEVVSDAPGTAPWGLLYEGEPQAAALTGFWGASLPLGVGRRVHPLRVFPFFDKPTVLAALPSGPSGALEQTVSRLGGTVVRSAHELFAKLKTLASDVLVLAVEPEGACARIGDQTMDFDELRQAIASAEAGNPHPLLVVVPTPTAQDAAWSTVVHSATRHLASVIAPEHTAGEPGAAAAAFLNKFIVERLPIGEALRQMRSEQGAAALAWSAFCPPYLQVLAADEAPDAGAPGPKLWPLPEAPYRPLAPFEREDRALYSGRDDDIARFTRLLDDLGTRGIFLHGGPGVGKASFLRAGVLPTLEDEAVGYLALRDRTDDQTQAERDYPTLALRPGGDLAGQLAAGLADFCARPFVYVTPAGKTVTVDLPGLLRQHAGPASASPAGASSEAIQAALHPGAVTATPSPPPASAAAAPDAVELWQSWQTDPCGPRRLLESISEALPFELIIVVEQAEDLITQVKDDEGRRRRRRALDMLADLGESKARCKLVLSLRTEFYGQLATIWPAAAHYVWSDYHLSTLSAEQMVEALLLPTATEPTPYGSEAPHAKYRFAFEADVVRRIVEDSRELAGALHLDPLAHAHAVCAYLVKRAKERGNKVIHASELRHLAGVAPRPAEAAGGEPRRPARKGPITEALPKFFAQTFRELKLPRGSQQRLRALIARLYERHEGGVITRKLAPVTELRSGWRGPGALEEAINAASAEPVRLLDVQQLVVDGREEIYVSPSQELLTVLGPEAVEGSKREALARSKLIDWLFIIIPLAILGIAATYYLTRTAARGGEEDEEGARQEIARLQGEAQLANQPLYAGALAQADQALRAGNLLRARQLLMSQQPNQADRKSDLRGFDWLYLWRQLNRHRQELQGHDGMVHALAASPDGKLLATAAHDGTVRLWNLQRQGEVAAILSAKKGPVRAAAFSADGKQLAAAGDDGVIRVWDVKVGIDAPEESDQPAKTLAGHAGPVHALSFGKDALVSGGADNKVIVWDVAAAKPRATLEDHEAPVTAVARAAGGKSLASAGRDGVILLWDEAGKKKHTLKVAGAVAHLAFAPDGKTLASAGAETEAGADLGVLRLWSAESGSELKRIVHGNGLLAVAFRPKANVVLTAGKDRSVRGFDPATGKETFSLPGHYGWVHALAFTPDGGTLASASHDNTVKLWDMSEVSRSDVLPGHKDWALALAFSADNRVLASGGRDGMVKLWDAGTGALLEEWNAKAPVTALAFGGDEKTMQLAVGAWSKDGAGALKALELRFALGKLAVKELPALEGHKQGVACLAFSATNLLASGGEDGAAILWDLAAGKSKHLLAAGRPVRALAFSPSGAALATGDAEGHVRLWDAQTGAPLPRPADEMRVHDAAIAGLIFLNDDFLFVSAGADHAMKLWTWRAKQGGELARIYRSHHQPLSSLVHLGGASVATASWDHTVKLWDVREPKTGDERLTLVGHTGPVRALAISPNRQILASAGHDGTIRLWRASAVNAPPAPK